VEKLVYGGDALARLDGRVVLTPFALPGETVRVQPEREQPGLIRAKTLEVLRPAPERVAAPCPYFGRCGGCHYQHAPYEYQVSAKRDIVAEEMRRVGKIAPPDEIEIIASKAWGYRNRVQLHIEGNQIGYREAGSHKLCAIDHCPISSPRLNEVIRSLAEMVRDARWPRFLSSIEVFTDERQVQLNVTETARPVARRFFDWCAEKIPNLVHGALDYEDRFRVSPSAFFQVNRFMAGRMVEAALEGVGGETAMDLYAGVGLFSVSMAKRFQTVTAIETGAAAIRDLEFNASRGQLQGVHARQASTEQYLHEVEHAPDFMLLDPPRAGLGKPVVRRLLELKPPVLTIVACDPATLARDLAGLLSGGYRIRRMIMADLFPQTYHIESIVRLEH
jgi:23S rRNA (uracil1939-C5)-methyltransferase